MAYSSNNEADVSETISLLCEQNESGDTILHTSASEDSSQLIAQLLGPLNVEQRHLALSLRNKIACTPLHLAVALNQTNSTVDLLLKAISSSQKLLLEFLVATDEDDITALQLAVRLSKVEFVETILK